MISLTELRFALRGLLRILRFDASFVQYFDRSTAGARRSFWICVPTLLLIWGQMALLHDANDPPMTARIWIVTTAAHLINFCYFPLILLAIGKYIERDAYVVGCVTVYNWLNTLSICLAIPLILLHLIQADHSVQVIIFVIGFALPLICEGYILAVCLKIPGMFALAFVALDFVIGKLLFDFSDYLSKGPLF